MRSTGRNSAATVLLFTAYIASTYGFGLYLFPALVESIRVDIPFSYATMGTISGFVQAGFMAAALLAGFLTARVDALPMILGSIAACALALAGLAVAPNVICMAILLTALGGAAAAIWVPMVEVARDRIAREHQAKALGLMSSGTSYGVFINSFLLTALLPSQGWRALWVATAAIVAVLAILGLVSLRRRKRQPAASQDDHPLSMRARVGTLPAGLTLAIVFMMFLNGLSCMPYQTYLSAFLQSEAGYSAATAAHAWRVIGLVGMVSGFAVGALSDRITVRLGMFLTYGILAASCLLLLVARGGDNFTALYGATVAFGVSFYAVFGLVPAYIGHFFGGGSAALVFAFGNIALGLGGIVGNTVGGWLKESSGSFAPIYFVMLAAALVSAALSAIMPSEKRVGVEALPANA
jgi:predicted MFS family arabinose efflux permease